jgi:glyoxylase I family protein
VVDRCLPGARKERIMIKTSFAHVGLNCRSIRVTERFYCKHFGFKRARVVPLGRDQIVFLRSKRTWLELFKSKGEGKKVQKDGPAEAGFRHMAFKVSSVDGKLREMGRSAKVTLGPFGFDDFIKGWRGVWIMDPDGRILELSQGYKDQRNPSASGRS